MTDLTRRFERRPLAKPNVTYYLWRFAANGVRTGRALATPPVFGDARTIASELTREGIVVGSSDRFLSETGREALAAASAAIRTASRSDAVRAIIAGETPQTVGKKHFRVDLVRGAIRAENSLLKVALDVKLLETVANYLGMWPALHYIGVWLNYPTNEPATSSQLWHHDPEDLKIIKTFIYLEDVCEENGPFTFVPGTHPFGRHVPQAARYDHARRVKDEEIARIFPPSTWRVCTGPAGTMIVADTLGFHRGGKPACGTRLLVTLTYTSGTPLVERAIRLKGEPTWMSSLIQRYAVKQLHIAPGHRENEKKEKSAAMAVAGSRRADFAR